jgi:hypothetical protein
MQNRRYGIGIEKRGFPKANRFNSKEAKEQVRDRRAEVLRKNKA